MLKMIIFLFQKCLVYVSLVMLCNQLLNPLRCIFLNQLLEVFIETSEMIVCIQYFALLRKFHASKTNSALISPLQHRLLDYLKFSPSDVKLFASMVM